jgi:hypothetical protein
MCATRALGRATQLTAVTWQSGLQRIARMTCPLDRPNHNLSEKVDGRQLQMEGNRQGPLTEGMTCGWGCSPVRRPAFLQLRPAGVALNHYDDIGL